MLENIEEMFDQSRALMKKLNKETYKERMKDFMKQQGHYYDEMLTFVEEAEDSHAAMEEVSDLFIERVKGKYANKKGKLPAARRGDIDIMLLFYFFPGLLKTKYEKRQEMADVLCERWNTAVGSHLTVSDYATIYAGFRERFLGLFRI